MNTNIDKESFLQQVSNIGIGVTIDFKGGILCRTITKIAPNEYEIDQTAGDWVSTTVTYNQVRDLVYGVIDFIDLDWK
jgi:hypothetical protein